MQPSTTLVRGNLASELCPSRIVLDHLSSRWGTLVLRTLLGGTRRFSELRRAIGGVSEKMLAQTLHALERDGLVERIAYPVIPPKVEYRLTDLGREAATHVDALLTWIEDRVPLILRHQDVFDARRTT